MLEAIREARQFVGATAPNPPVGAAALDARGELLLVRAHERAGTGHAEARVLAELTEGGRLKDLHTLFITLEPCNHHGRTPPCTEAILRAAHARARQILATRSASFTPLRIVYGIRDPNPKVAGQGAQRLSEAVSDIPGIPRLLEVNECTDPALRQLCEELIRPFAHAASTGLPWVVVKTAHQVVAQTHPSTPASLDYLRATMIPPPGLKTFTSPTSLILAHELRRRADTILTGSGTVLADSPEFTVRRVEDHASVRAGLKKRRLVVLDRRGRVPETWANQAQAHGFELMIRTDLLSALEELGDAGALEVLVEAGPELTSAILALGLWNEHVIVRQIEPPLEDRIEVMTNVHWHHPGGRYNPSHS